jgi:hypothetical protein
MSRRKDDNKVLDLHEARDRLLAMIGTDKAAFTMHVHECQDSEYFTVRIEYEICGVHYEREEGRLKIMVNLNSMDPVEVRIEPGKVKEVMTMNIAENCPFLLKGTYHLYFDRDSIREINKEARRKEFKRELDYIIRDRGFTMEEMLPMVYEFLLEALPETPYASLEDLSRERAVRPAAPERFVVEMTPPGVPCPHCSGHLSIKVLKDLTMKWYSRYYRGDEPFD